MREHKSMLEIVKSHLFIMLLDSLNKTHCSGRFQNGLVKHVIEHEVRQINHILHSVRLRIPGITGKN